MGWHGVVLALPQSILPTFTSLYVFFLDGQDTLVLGRGAVLWIRIIGVFGIY